MNVRLLRRGIAALAVASAFAACSTSSSPEALVGSAKSYLAKSDYPAAIIQLKNALQEAPNNGEARLLLAKAMLESGDPIAAETEARKALDYKYSANDTVPVIARAMLMRGDFRKLVNEFGDRRLDDPAAQADLATSLATAWLALTETDKAVATIDAALALKPDASRALVLKAQLTAQRGDVAGSRKFVDAALAAAPNDPEASLFKAELDAAEGSRSDAIKTLQEAATAHPFDVATRAALVSHLVAAHELDKAAATLAEMQKIAPRDLRTYYAGALAALAKQDLVRARDLIQQVLATRPGYVPALYVSGLINYQLGNNAAAEEALRGVLARAPGNVNAAQILAGVYLRTGRATSALEVLDPAMKRVPNDPALLRLVAEAYLQSANPAKAAQYYERANAVDKTNVPGRVRLAQLRFATGDPARGFADLESVSESEVNNTQADLALVSAHLARREFDKAQAAASVIEKKQPASPVGPYMQGLISVSKRDLPAARASYEKAVSIQPGYFPAVYSLALLDLADGKADDARKRFEKLLEKDPKNEQVLLALAQLAAMTGAPADQIKAALDRAIAATPDSPSPRVAAITYYLRIDDAKTALTIAEAAQGAFRTDPTVVDAYASAQMAAGDVNQSVDTFKRVVQLQPQNANSLLRLASAQLATKDFEGAADSARKALAINADLAQAWITLVKAYVVSGRPQEALAEARKVQHDHADRAFGYTLEAEVFAQQGQWAQAANAAREALKRQPSGPLAVRLYMALQQGGKEAEASAMADKWMRDNPKDVAMRAFFAEQSQRRKDYRAAAQYYRDVLDIDPDNVVALNNLAWVLAETNDPKAREFAERAYQQAPFNPNVLDTYGWLLVQQNDIARGKALLQMASNLAAKEPIIRLHYAKALAKSGDKAGAKRELDVLAKSSRTGAAVRGEMDKLRSEL